jgi:hypothetical protein
MIKCISSCLLCLSCRRENVSFMVDRALLFCNADLPQSWPDDQSAVLPQKSFNDHSISHCHPWDFITDIWAKNIRKIYSFNRWQRNSWWMSIIALEDVPFRELPLILGNVVCSLRQDVDKARAVARILPYQSDQLLLCRSASSTWNKKGFNRKKQYNQR